MLLNSYFLSREFDVAPNQVYAPIIGEHGDSQVAVWSHAQSFNDITHNVNGIGR
jgi:malate/lactate dehydrogenase